MFGRFSPSLLGSHNFDNAILGRLVFHKNEVTALLSPLISLLYMIREIVCIGYSLAKLDILKRCALPKGEIGRFFHTFTSFMILSMIGVNLRAYSIRMKPIFTPKYLIWDFH